MSNFVKKVQNLFRSKAFVIFISIVIAVISWVFVMDSTNPGAEENFTVNVALANAGIPAKNNLLKVEQTAQTVRIKVSGRKKLLEKLSTTDFTVNADLSQITEAGKFNVKLDSPECKKLGVKIVDYSPKSISFTYDEKTQKNINIKVNDVEKYLAKGYELISVTTEPASIPFSGFSNEIEDLDHIEIDLSSQITTIDENKHLTYIAKYISDTGVDISSKFDVEKIKVNIYVAKRVPITYTVDGKPAQDCYVDSEVLNVPDVLVRASDDLYSNELKKLESIDLGTIDVNGKSATFDAKYDAETILGEHLELVDRKEKDVRLSVRINQKEVRSFRVLWSSVKLVDKNENYDYVTDDSPLGIYDQKFVVKLKAKPTDFDAFDESAMVISLAYPQEECEMQRHNLTFKLPDNIELADTYFVYITATEKQEATPEPTETPTITEDVTNTPMPTETPTALPTEKQTEFPLQN